MKRQKQLRTRVSSAKVVRDDAKRKYDEVEAKHKTLAEELTTREGSQPEQKPSLCVQNEEDLESHRTCGSFFVQTKNTLTGILCSGALEGN